MGNRFFNRTAQLFIDLAILAAAYVLAYEMRFEGHISVDMLRTLAWTLPYVVALHYFLMMSLGVHRFAWRHVALPDVRRIALAIFASAMVMLASRLFAAPFAKAHPALVRGIIPVGVTLTTAAFAFLGIAGARVVRRMLAERGESGDRISSYSVRVPTMLVGAGSAGALVAKEIGARPDLGIEPVGFVDDDPATLGSTVHGIRVLGNVEQLAALCERHGAKQALITIASVSGKEIRRITEICENARISVKIIPAMSEIVGGQVNLSRIRSVAIEDLLRREPVMLDEDAIAKVVKGRVVLITGAGGSIGSELCRQVCRFAPKVLVLVEQAENNLFHIERELRASFKDVPLHACVGSIRDAARMTSVFAAYGPDVVFHAAAHKHVPLMEVNPGEAIKNNVLGTKLLAEIADAFGVAEFVMISTDKAVNPTSIMGASKRAAEIFIQAFSLRSKTHFIAVRFGNVLGSAGSVVPIFQEQIARGGPITITHPDMKRYFMTIPEACRLVLQAGTMGRGGEIFVLDMGEPVKIVDLARDLIRLSGFREGEDIEIRYTGVRPGEKLFEELALVEEGAERTRHPKVFIGRIQPHPWDEVIAHVALLEEAAQTNDAVKIRALLRTFIPQFCLHTPEFAQSVTEPIGDMSEPLVRLPISAH